MPWLLHTVCSDAVCGIFRMIVVHFYLHRWSASDSDTGAQIATQDHIKVRPMAGRGAAHPSAERAFELGSEHAHAMMGDLSHLRPGLRSLRERFGYRVRR